MRRRLFGQKGRAWIGANPVPAQWVSGLVTEDATGAVLVGGVPEPGAFVLNVPGRPVMRRGPDGRLERVGVDILHAAGLALDRAEAQAPDEFERQFRVGSRSDGEPLDGATRGEVQKATSCARWSPMLKAGYPGWSVEVFESSARRSTMRRVNEALFIVANAIDA